MKSQVRRLCNSPTIRRELHAAILLLSITAVVAFSPSIPSSSTNYLVAEQQQRARNSCVGQLSGVTFASGGSESRNNNNQVEDDSDIQWELFLKHHAQGSWKGIWTTYDYIGDVVDETVASVDLVHDPVTDTIQQTHQIVVGAKRSDCETCFDSMEIKSLPVATFSKQNLRKSRFAACGMINGPSLLRSGSMATELVLRHGDGRVRVTFQHAPVWQRGTEPGSGPPDGLKLFRTTISREALRDAPPTEQTEQANPPTTTDPNNPIFVRPVPPFNWHKYWAGTSWTWGPNTGNQGWGIDALEEADAWHGSAPVEVWNLRLPGGVFVQCPRVLTPDSASYLRLAWLPNDDTLLRMEAAILCLQPVFDEEETMILGLEPPSLASCRCDVLTKMGDLEGEPSFVRDAIQEQVAKMEQQESTGVDNEPQPVQQPTPQVHAVKKINDDDKGDLKDARDALQL